MLGIDKKAIVRKQKGGVIIKFWIIRGDMTKTWIWMRKQI